MRSDDVIATVSRFIADTMARKLRWLLIVVGLGLIGIVYAHGMTWTTFFVVLIGLMALGSGWIAFSFWIWFFRNLGRSKEEQR
ncbi:MAG: hypothetical protein Q7T81_11040 [Pseudolabrys sp.]|nr:hypothetical protein [Pseudolabrys sp.]